MKNIIEISKYKVYQPDIEVVGITDIQIQSAINTATTNINSLTGCIAYEVWDFNVEDDGTIKELRDVNNKLFRTAQELEWIQDAWLAQTQYVLSNGNDFHNGQESFSGGGISYSQTLSERPLIRQDVFNYLVKARVYERSINIGNNTSTENKCGSSRLGAWDGTGMTTLMDREWGDSRYVLHHQTDENKGKYAYCNETNGNVEFRDISNLNWNNIQNKPNTKYIKDISVLRESGNPNLDIEAQHIQLDNGESTTTRHTIPTATNSGNGLLSSVDKLKLDNLNEHFRGHYASLAALKTAIPAGNDGDYAYIEGGTNLQIAYWDNDWVLSGSTSGITSLGIGTDINDSSNSKSLAITNTDPNNIILSFNQSVLREYIANYTQKIYRHFIQFRAILLSDGANYVFFNCNVVFDCLLATPFDTILDFFNYIFQKAPTVLGWTWQLNNSGTIQTSSNQTQEVIFPTYFRKATSLEERDTLIIHYKDYEAIDWTWGRGADDIAQNSEGFSDTIIPL